MVVGRRSAVVLACVVVVSNRGFAQSSQQQQQGRSEQVATTSDAMPANVETGPLTADVVALLRRSETFQAQCGRIAAAPRVHVRLRVVNTVEGGGRAQTALRHDRTGALYAEVELLFGENYVELLAHEFEHVIEQIEGIDLRYEAAAGRAWQVDNGAYETRRAAVVGVEVLREYSARPVRALTTQALR